VPITATGKASDIFDKVYVAPSLPQSLASVHDVANKNLYTVFPPTSRGGGGFIGDLQGNVVGVTDANYNIDIRTVGTTVGTYEIPSYTYLPTASGAPVTNTDSTSLQFIDNTDTDSTFHTFLTNIEDSLNIPVDMPSTTNTDTPKFTEFCKLFKLSDRTRPIGAKEARVMLWHQILDHPSREDMIAIADGELIDGFDLTADDIRKHSAECLACIRSKMKRTPFEEAETDYSALAVAAIVELDIFGNVEPLAVGGYPYLLTAYDRKSGFTVARLSRHKDGESVALFIRELHAFFKRHGHTLKILRTDHENVLKCPVIKNQLSLLPSMTLQRAAPHSHEQVGGVERRHGTLGIAVAAQFAQAPHMPKMLWGVAAHKCILLRNLVPNTRTGRKTSPHMMVYGIKADIRHRPILDFGATVEVLIDKTQREWKFGAHAEAGWYIGPDMDVKDAIQVYLPKKNLIVRRRDFKVTSAAPAADLYRASATTIYVEREAESNLWLEGLQRYPHAVEGLTMMCDSPAPPPVPVPPAGDQRGTPTPAVPSSESPAPVPPAAQTPAETIEEARVRLITEIAGQQRIEQESTGDHARTEAAKVRRLKLEELLSLTQARTPTRADSRRLLVALRKLKQRAGMDKADNPTLTEALRGTDRIEWLKAIEAEVKSIYETNKCFDEISIEVNFSIEHAEFLPSHFILKRKRKADGTLDKYKARLVANGSRQPDELYANSTSPTARALSVNILLCIAASEALFIRTFDVKSAFLHSELPEGSNPIYIKLPIGESVPHAGSWAKLRKSIYGLRQAPELWFMNIVETLLSFGFTQTISDECLFVYHAPDGEYTYASLHVDDLLVVSTNEALIDKLGDHLEARYGEISESDGNSHLGLQIDRDIKGSIRITQPALLQKLFLHTDIAPHASAETPYLSDTMHFDDDLVDIDMKPYQVAVGIMNYLTHSRPDIRYALSVLASAASKPTRRHWRMAQQVAIYLQATRELGVTFHHGAPIDLHGFADASYATATDARSQTGLAFKISPDSAVVTSQSLIQTIVALSSTEAELDGLCKATTMATAIRVLMHELGRTMSSPTTLYEDNKSSMALTKGNGAWSRTRHFKVRYHHIKLAIQDGTIEIKYCPTTQQLADLLTKPLPAYIFKPLRDQLLGIQRSFSG
jgi:hypothetical protein